MPSDDDFKAGQQALWNRMAAGWDARYGEFERFSAPVNRWLCDAAGLRPGMNVLDIASGAGQPAFMVAERVAPGRVLATDISDAMVAALNRRAAAAGTENLEANTADMDALDLEDKSFDAVTCRWGFMFSQQPVRAMAEARRVLKPGGVLATATWDAETPVPLGTLLHRVLDELAGLPPGRELVPSPIDTPSELRASLERAGFASVTVERLDFAFEFVSPDAWWQFLVEISTPNRRRVDALGPTALTEARRHFAEAAEGLRDGDRLVVPAACLCAAART